MDPHSGTGRRVAQGTSSVSDAFGNKVNGTSIKVHHGPGGASSFSLGGGYGGEGSVLDKKRPAAASAAVGQPAETEEVKAEAEQVVQAESGSTGAAAATSAAPATRQVAPGTASVTDAFGNKVNGTSIRVHAPPGGASSITF